MKKTKRSQKVKLIILLSLLIVLVSSGVLFTINNNLKGNVSVETQESLIQRQKEIDKTIISEGYTINNPNIILNPYEISPLTALIIFESDSAVSVELTIKGKDNSFDIVQSFSEETKHYLPVYGLYPDYNNQVDIKVNDEVYSFNIKTAPLPEDFTKISEDIFVDSNYEDLFNNQFYFQTPASVGYTSAFDYQGEVRWYLTKNLVWDISRLENNNLLLSNERLINPPYYTTGMYEISLLGKIYNEFVLPGGYHHDFYELENNNLIVASNNFDHGTVEDIIVEVDRKSGEIVKEIDLKEILKVNEAKSENWVDYDWFHNNSVFYDKKTNSLTLSGRHQDLVVNIDYDSLEINYIIGDKTGVSLDYQKYFLTPTNDLEWPYSQHAAKILPDGNVFIFDNGNNRSKIKEAYLPAKDNYSRGVIYKVDKEKMEISQVFQYGKERGSTYYSSYISDVDYLNPDHYLIHSGGVAYKDGEICNKPPGIENADKLKSFTTEVFNGEKIFELILDTNNYRAEKMPLYTSGEKFKLESPKYLGSLNKTKVYNHGYKILNNVNYNPNILEDYNLEISKEYDRLVVSGDFKSDDKVSIILYHNFYFKEYDVRVSRRPYTAMCLDIFSDQDSLSVSKYINDKGLSGEFTIFISINDQIYKTNQTVLFK